MQPRPERAAPVEAVEIADGGEKRLLRDVLGGRRVVDDEVGRPMCPRPVQAEERLDPRGGPPLGGAHEGALVAAGAHAPTLRPRRTQEVPHAIRTKQASCDERAMRARSIGTPPALKVQSVPCESDGVRISPKPCCDVVRPERDGDRSDPAPVERMDAQDAVVAARHERAVVDERDVLGRRVSCDRADQPARARVVDRDAGPGRPR